MRTYVFAAIAAALFALPTSAFSEEIYIGPGGVRVGFGWAHLFHDRKRANCHKALLI